MILIGAPTEFQPYEAISDSNTEGGELSYVADQPFLVRSNSTSNYFNEETGAWVTHIRRVSILQPKSVQQNYYNASANHRLSYCQ